MTKTRFERTVIFLAFTCLIFYPPFAKAEEFFDILCQTYRTNPSLKAAEERLKETKERYPQATAGWKPSVTAEGSIYATDIDNSNFGNGDGATTKDLTLSLDQPLWRGGQTFAETKEAQELIKAGEAVLHETEQDILLRAVTAMLNLKRDRSLYNLRAKNEDILRSERTAAQERFDSGVLTITDVDQARARLSRAEANLVNASGALDISKAEFEEVTGQDVPATLSIPNIDFQFPATLDDMLAYAETANPSLWIARFQERAADYNANATFRELFPQISAFASYNKQYDPQPGIIPDSQTETIGLRAVIPLYQAGATRSRIREARHRARRFLYESEAAQRQIRQQIVSNYRAYINAKAERKALEDEITASEEALKGVREEAKLGQRTILDILDSDRDLINAQVALIHIKRDEELAKYSLAASLGILNAANLGLVEK